MTLIERTIRERIVLVGVAQGRQAMDEVEEDLDELALLVDTAGADVVARVVQRRATPDPATYLGRGKVAELVDVCVAVDADTVVFDAELNPAQQRNLEKLLGRTAIDRTAVILDIFAQNARSEAGKAQVELALLRYRLPRLRGRGQAMSRLAGGIGTRGPGETKLEVDRRRLLARTHRLEKDLKGLRKVHGVQRRARSRSSLPKVSLVGYTNAGKSTLLNRLTGRHDAYVADRLFATLDLRTRRVELAPGEVMLVADTVGFVRKLPHELIEAFATTLAEAIDADLLLHVVDAAAPDPERQISAVRDVLGGIGAGAVPELVVVNKADRAPQDAARIGDRHPGSVVISAATGTGVGMLLARVQEELRHAGAAPGYARPPSPWPSAGPSAGPSEGPDTGERATAAACEEETAHMRGNEIGGVA